jgi:hypothetical protein
MTNHTIFTPVQALPANGPPLAGGNSAATVDVLKTGYAGPEPTPPVTPYFAKAGRWTTGLRGHGASAVRCGTCRGRRSVFHTSLLDATAVELRAAARTTIASASARLTSDA